MSCIFCKIIAGEIPATVVADTKHTLAIKDIEPQAEVHVLVMPKKHIASLNELKAEDVEILMDMHQVAQKLAKQLGIHERGYRWLTNCGVDGGQSVQHLHFHLMGGEKLGGLNEKTVK